MSSMVPQTSWNWMGIRRAEDKSHCVYCRKRFEKQGKNYGRTSLDVLCSPKTANTICSGIWLFVSIMCQRFPSADRQCQWGTVGNVHFQKVLAEIQRNQEKQSHWKTRKFHHKMQFQSAPPIFAQECAVKASKFWWITLALPDVHWLGLTERSSTKRLVP